MKKIAVLLSLAVVLAASPAFAATQNVFLAQGFNFYALTVTPGATDTIKDADTLFANVAEMNQLFRFNATTKAFEYKLRLPNGSLFGNNFPLAAGTGYVFKTTAQKSVTFAGTAAATATSDLVTGFNFVGFPTVATVPTARGLLSTYATQLKSVFVWNYNTQAFQFVIRLDAQNLFGTDFEILPGSAFFVDAVSAVSVNFGAVTAPADVNAAITGEIDGATLVTGAPSLAPNRVLAGQFTVSLLKQDNTVVATVQANPTATGYAFSFTNVPAYTSYKIVAKGPNNEYVAGIVGQIVGNTAKNLNANTTALSLMIERDSSKFVTLLGSSASTYAAEETRLLALMANSLATVQANTERMRKLVATAGITLTDLRAGLLARVEIPIDLATQLAAYYADPGKRAVEAMDAYKQAIALIGSQAGRENALYVEQALALLTGITGANLDSATYLALSAEEKKQVAVATAMAYNYKGDIEAKIGATTTQTAPARSFMAAYKSLGPSSVAHYEAYRKSLEILNKHKKNVPADQSDPALLGAQLKAETPLAAEDPTYMQKAAQTADALKAKIESDTSLGGKVDLLGEDLDVIDVVDKKAEAFQKGGNPAGAVEAYNEIDENDASFNATKKDKAKKKKKYGIGKAKLDMGEVESAFDYLKEAVGDVVTAGGVQEADYAKFDKINEALLAMAAVIEQLKAQNSAKLSQTGNEGYADPATIAQKMDKKSEIYVTVVVVVVAGGTGSPSFGDNVIQTATDANRILLNEGMGFMSEFHFQFQVQSYASALTALTSALAKFDAVLAAVLETAETPANPLDATQVAAAKDAVRLRSQAVLQSGLVHFFRFRVSILQKAKNDDHRKNALKEFYKVRDRYSFLATEIESRVAELERYENLVEEIQSSDFELARKAVNQAIALLKVGDKAKAYGLLEDAIAKYNTEYTKVDAAATLKKESLKGWAEAKFYRVFAYADDAAEEKELVGMPEAVAALNLLRVRYTDLRAHVMDLQNRLTNAQLFAADAVGEGETADDTGVLAGAAALPAVYNHAMKLKEKADQLYQIGDTANALAAFNQAKQLFDLMMVDLATKQDLIDLLTDVQAKVDAVKAIAGIEIRNGYTLTGPRLTNPLYWQIVAASAQKEQALLYARRHFALRSDADRKVAIDLLNRAIAKYPEVPFVAEIRQIIDELSGQTTTNASAPILSNFKLTPQALDVSATAQQVALSVDVIDPTVATQTLVPGIASVKATVVFGGILVGEYELTNVPASATPKLNLLPGVNRVGAAGPRWTGTIDVPANAAAGEYIVTVKAVNTGGIGNELKAGFFIKPPADALFLTDVFVNDKQQMIVKLSKALPADDASTQMRVRVDIQQMPPAGVANAVPVTVAGYANLPLQRVDDLTRQIPITGLFDANFPFYGQFQISVKIVNLVGNTVIFKRAMPYFREKAIDQATDPVVSAFKAALKVFNYISTEQTTRLDELKKFAVHNYAPGTLEPAHATMFDNLFKAVSVSVMRVKQTTEATPKDILEVEYIRPDYAIVHALIERSQKYGKDTAAIFDAEGNVLLPPGVAGNTFAKEEWMEFPLFLVNNRWYLAFGQDESAQNDGVFVQNAFINAQQVLSVYLTRPVNIADYKVKLGVFKAPEPEKGIYTPRPVAGFEALDLRPVNPVADPVNATIKRTPEFAVPMQTVIPSTFPVYGALDFVFRVIDANGAEVATYGMPFHRPLETNDAERTALLARMGALQAAINAKSLAQVKALSFFNAETNKLGPGLEAWFTDVFSANTLNYDIDPAMVKIDRVDLNRVIFRLIQNWNIVFTQARAQALPLPDGTELPAGQTAYTFSVPFDVALVRVGTDWYWDTTPQGFYNDPTQAANVMPAVLDLYFGGNDDLVVRTSVGKKSMTAAEPPAVPVEVDNLVKLAILKPRFDGSLQPVAGYTMPTFFYAGSGTNHEWKLPVSQAIPQSLVEYGDLVLEARLFHPAGSTEPIARWQMGYFRPFAATNDEPIHQAALKYVSILNDKTKDANAKMDAIGLMSDTNPAMGMIDRVELPNLLGAFTQASFTVTVDAPSVSVHYPRPDFAELFGMVTFSGVYTNDLIGGLFSPVTGMQMLPPGRAGFALNDYYAPVNLRFRLVNGQWLKTNDDPYMAPTAGAGSYIQEAFIDQFGTLIVRAQEDMTPTPTPVYKVKVSIMTPPPPGTAYVQDIPVAGYENLEAFKNGDVYQIGATRLFGANFPVYGDLVIVVRLVNEAGAAPVTVSETRFPYFRSYQNAALETPLRTLFGNYLNALASRNMDSIKGFWSDGATLGQVPAIERAVMEEVAAKVTALQFTVEDPTQVYVQPLSPDRVSVNAIVKTDFRYRYDEWMGVYHPVTGEQVLPGGAAMENNVAVTHTFYRPFNLLLVRMKKADGTFGWYLASEAASYAGPATGTTPMIAGMYLDATDNFVVNLNMDVPVPPATGGYKVRLELLQPPVAGSANYMPTPIAGFSGTTAPQAVQMNGNTFTLARPIVLNDRLTVYGELIVQAVLTPADKLDQVVSTYDMPWFRPFTNISGQSDLETRFTNYVAALASCDTDRLTAYSAIKEMSAPGFNWGGAVLPIDDELTIKLNDQNFSALAAEIVDGSLMVFPISQTEAAIDAMVKFTVTPADTVNGLPNGIWVGGDQAQGFGYQFFPPLSKDADQEIHVPMHRYFRLNFADNKWYLADEAPIGENTDVPAILNAWIEQVPRLSNPAEFVDAIIVNTGTSDARYALKYDLVKVNDFGGFVNTQFMNTLLQTVEPKRYVVRINQIFTETFPEFGEFEFRFKLVDTQNGDTKVAEYPFRWFRQFQLDPAVKTALINQYRASVTAFLKPDWYAALPENSARRALLGLMADASDAVLGPVAFDANFQPAGVMLAHRLLHNRLNNFAMTLPANEEEFYVEMLGADEAVVHCGNVVWSGVYKLAVGYEGLSMPNGQWLLPPGEVGYEFNEWRGGMRRFVRVFDPATGTRVWKIKTFGFADDGGTAPPVPQFANGDLIDVHFEWDPTLGPNGDEKLVAAIYNDDETAYAPNAYVHQNAVVKIADKALVRNLAYEGNQNWAYYEISKTDLLAGADPALAEGQLDVQVTNGLADLARREFWMPYYYSNYVPLMDKPVTRDGQPYGVQFMRLKGTAPDGREAWYYEFGGTYLGSPTATNTIYAYQKPNEPPMMYGPFVVSKIPENPNSNGYSDLALVKVAAVPADFDPWSIRSEADLIAKNFPMTDAGVFFAPIVPHGSWLDMWPSGVQFIDGFCDGGRVIGFLFDGDRDDMNGMTPLVFDQANGIYNTAQRHYIFSSGQIPVVFTKVPGETGFSPVAWETLVNNTGVTTPLDSLDAVLALSSSLFTDTHHFFGRPIVELRDAGFVEGGAHLMSVDGMTPTAGPIQVNKNAPQHNIGGMGFGWNVPVADKVLLFLPSPDPNNMLEPPAPIRIVDNSAYGWNDMNVFFGSDALSGIVIPEGAQGVGGVLVVANHPFNPDGTFVQVSNPLPVFFGAVELQQGAVTTINTVAVALPATEPYVVLKPEGLHLVGEGFGLPVAMGTPGNRVLAFVTGTPGQPEFQSFDLLRNDMPEWTDTAIHMTYVDWMPENVPGMLAIFPFDPFNYVIDFQHPLTVPVPVKFVFEVQARVTFTGLHVNGLLPLYTDNAGAIDLTQAINVQIEGTGFGPFIAAAAPELDLVFQAFDGTIIPLAGNNLQNAWTDTTIGFDVPAAAQGQGVIRLRNVLTGLLSDENLMVRFAGGAEITANLATLNGGALPGGDTELPVNRLVDPAILNGSGFGPGSQAEPTRFLYMVDNPDVANATVRTLVADNRMNSWSEQSINFPASSWNWNGPGGPTDATEGMGLFITDAPIVAGGSFHIISNVAMIRLVVPPPVEGLVFGLQSLDAVSQQAGGPPAPTEFTLANPRAVTSMWTYHYYNNGTPAGTIGLVHLGTDGVFGTGDDQLYGPYQATGRDGQGGVPNAYWDVRFPELLNLPAGTYRVQVSNPDTWSFVPGALDPTGEGNGGTDSRGVFFVYALPEGAPTVHLLLNVESLDVTAGNSQATPLDMSQDLDPLFIVHANRPLPGLSGPTTPTFGLFWMPLGATSVTMISSNSDETRWQKDGGGNAVWNGCLAPRQAGLGQLFLTPLVSGVSDPDVSHHSNYVWVNFGDGGTVNATPYDGTIPSRGTVFHSVEDSGGVGNGGTASQFTLGENKSVTFLRAYMWNGGPGADPTSVSAKLQILALQPDQSFALHAEFPAVASTQVNNPTGPVFWDADLSASPLALGPGTYQFNVTPNDFWSANSGTQGMGLCWLYGEPVAPAFRIDAVNGTPAFTADTPPAPSFTFSTPFDATQASGETITLTGNFPPTNGMATYRLVAVYMMGGSGIETVLNNTNSTWNNPAGALAFPKSLLDAGAAGFLAVRDMSEGGGDLSNAIYFNNGFIAAPMINSVSGAFALGSGERITVGGEGFGPGAQPMATLALYMRPQGQAPMMLVANSEPTMWGENQIEFFAMLASAVPGTYDLFVGDLNNPPNAISNISSIEVVQP